jgi:hypothetical protein
MFNRVRHFIKTVTLNSGLNREKFINNKKNVNKVVSNNNNNKKNKNKNNNMIIVRKMSTHAHPSGNNNNNNNNYIYMFIMALSASYIPHIYNKKN